MVALISIRATSSCCASRTISARRRRRGRGGLAAKSDRGGGVKRLGRPGPHHRRPPHLEIFFVADLTFDLLGDPLPEGGVTRGRLPHSAPQTNRNKIIN